MTYIFKKGSFYLTVENLGGIIIFINHFEGRFNFEEKQKSYSRTHYSLRIMYDCVIMHERIGLL